MVDISIVVETHLCISPIPLTKVCELCRSREPEEWREPSPRTQSANCRSSQTREFLLEFVNSVRCLKSANLVCELEKVIYLKMISELKLKKTKECSLQTMAI